MLSLLSVYALLESELLSRDLQRSLPSDRYSLTRYDSDPAFLKAVAAGGQQPDCLILQEGDHLLSLIPQLIHKAILLPTVIVIPDAGLAQIEAIKIDKPEGLVSTAATLPSCYYYHPAEVLIAIDQIDQIHHGVDRAITQFLQLPPLTKLTESLATLSSHNPPDTAPLDNRQVLMRQQQRLTQKLKERLGYLGVYYKRDPKQFLRYLPPPEAQEIMDTLRSLYRGIVLSYFPEQDNLNQLIDEFVHLAFFADIAVTTIVEMHMELMDELSKQLKLEGRSEDILLDYRLTLIDTIAHLCEMYRRSIPREA